MYEACLESRKTGNKSVQGEALQFPLLKPLNQSSEEESESSFEDVKKHRHLPIN